MAGPGWGLIAVFLAFHITGGLVGLPVIFMSIILSRQMHRHPTLLNFCATWTIASVVYTLLYDKLHNGSPTTLLMDSLEVYSPGRKERTILRSVYVSLKQPW